MAVIGILTSTANRSASRFAVPTLMAAPGLRDSVSHSGAVTVGRDRVAVADGGRLAGRIAGLDRGEKTAESGLALVAAADTAFADIDTRLDEMRALAAQAASVKLNSTDPTPPATTRVERAILDESFARLRAEIDSVANGTTHDGIAILAGGSGGGPLDLAYTVGGEGAGADSITVSIRAGTVAELDAELASADLFSVASATAALADVETAVDSVDLARAGLSAGAVRLRAAASGARTRAESEIAAAGDRFATHVAVDVTHKVAGEVADERGIEPILRETEAVRELLEIFKFPDAGATAGDAEAGLPFDATADRDEGSAALASSSGDDSGQGASRYDKEAGKSGSDGGGAARGSRVDIDA